MKKNSYRPSNSTFREESLQYIIIVIITLLTLLIMGYSNSPLCEYIGEDGGIFLLMGKNLIHGGTLYSDLFDHKGPVIFWLNAIPQLFIKGTFGVWLLELAFLITSAMLIYRTGKLLVAKRPAMIAPIIYVGMMGILFNGGNCTEEYSNFFTIILIYIFVKWQKSGIIPRIDTSILGFCFAIQMTEGPVNVIKGVYNGYYTIINITPKQYIIMINATPGEAEPQYPISDYLGQVARGNDKIIQAYYANRSVTVR